MEDANRQVLDAKVVQASLEAGSEEVHHVGVQIVCPNHRDSHARALYLDGIVRLQCSACGFDFARIKVEDGSKIEDLEDKIHELQKYGPEED